MNYSTNEVSDVKKATTLACIFPGAGQIYNKSYWKVPFVVGGFAAMIYCIDWNNRGYQRFKKAYRLLSDYEKNPDATPTARPTNSTAATRRTSSATCATTTAATATSASSSRPDCTSFRSWTPMWTPI